MVDDSEKRRHDRRKRALWGAANAEGWMPEERIAVIGAGVGGLTAAIALAAAGFRVDLFERGHAPGGKIHRVGGDGPGIDGGPTVFTMRWVFDELFEQAGTRLDDHLTLHPLDILARHGWRDGSRFDLFADIERSAEQVAAFSGGAEADRFRRFCADSAAIFKTLDAPFMAQPGPDAWTLLRGASPAALLRTRPFTTMWKALGEYFHDPRLRQLFGRYATYCGSSPFSAPATLMLVAHVEQAGVWSVEGGMIELARSMDRLAERLGVVRHYDKGVDRIETDHGRVTAVQTARDERFSVDGVIFNGDAAALHDGLLGEEVRSAGVDYPFGRRSLSALTWALTTTASGFDYHRHNVFFSSDYEREFDELARGRLPGEPTLYVCAQDRDDGTPADRPPASERFLCLVNAPALGDEGFADDDALSDDQIERCRERTWAHLEACGARIEWTDTSSTTSPKDFARMFPATGGALYGLPAKGWRASFQRLPVRTKIGGLYLAGGSVHPGPGVPMAARSGRAAAASLIADLTSTRKYHPVAMSGGTSTA
jgi:1-hydroxycarotenoid 3,4-desaturase